MWLRPTLCPWLCPTAPSWPTVPWVSGPVPEMGQVQAWLSRPSVSPGGPPGLRWRGQGRRAVRLGCGRPLPTPPRTMAGKPLWPHCLLPILPAWPQPLAPTWRACRSPCLTEGPHAVELGHMTPRLWDPQVPMTKMAVFLCVMFQGHHVKPANPRGHGRHAVGAGC